MGDRNGIRVEDSYLETRIVGLDQMSRNSKFSRLIEVVHARDDMDYSSDEVHVHFRGALVAIATTLYDSSVAGTIEKAFGQALGGLAAGGGAGAVPILATDLADKAIAHWARLQKTSPAPTVLSFQGEFPLGPDNIGAEATEGPLPAVFARLKFKGSWWHTDEDSDGECKFTLRASMNSGSSSTSVELSFDSITSTTPIPNNPTAPGTADYANNWNRPKPKEWNKYADQKSKIDTTSGGSANDVHTFEAELVLVGDCTENDFPLEFEIQIQPTAAPELGSVVGGIISAINPARTVDNTTMVMIDRMQLDLMPLH